MRELMPLDQISKRLADRNLRAVADRSGLSHPTVRKLAKGAPNLSLKTWRKISDYLHDNA